MKTSAARLLLAAVLAWCCLELLLVDDSGEFGGASGLGDPTDHDRRALLATAVEGERGVLHIKPWVRPVGLPAGGLWAPKFHLRKPWPSITSYQSLRQRFGFLNVTVGVFFVPLGGDGRKHPLGHYREGLARTCAYLRSLGLFREVLALGDPDFIKATPGCEWLSSSSSDGEGWSGRYRLEDLRHAAAAKYVVNSGCKLKFNTSISYNSMQRGPLTIWLNKIHVLSDLAHSRLPDRRAVALIDAAMPDRYLPRVVELASAAAARDGDDDGDGAGGPPRLWALRYRYREDDWRRWNGARAECAAPPIASAPVLATRGDRDAAEALRGAYAATVARMAKQARAAGAGGGGCGCFDEETVLSEMFRERPEMFRFFWKTHSVYDPNKLQWWKKA